MKSPLAAKPKCGDFLTPCQPADGIGMDFELLGDLPHCICFAKSVFHQSPIRSVTKDNKFVVKIVYKNRRNVPKNGCFGPSGKLNQEIDMDTLF